MGAYSNTDSDSVTAAATTVSIIHSTQANVAAHGPQAGTQTSTHISISVAKPMGMVPRKSELIGSRIMTPQISGYSVYRTMDVVRASVKRMVLRTKKTIDSQ